MREKFSQLKIILILVASKQAARLWSASLQHLNKLVTRIIDQQDQSTLHWEEYQNKVGKHLVKPSNRVLSSLTDWVTEVKIC